MKNAGLPPLRGFPAISAGWVLPLRGFPPFWRVGFFILSINMITNSFIRINISKNFSNIFSLEADILVGVNIGSQLYFQISVDKCFLSLHYYSI